MAQAGGALIAEVDCSGNTTDVEAFATGVCIQEKKGGSFGRLECVPASEALTTFYAFSGAVVIKEQFWNGADCIGTPVSERYVATNRIGTIAHHRLSTEI